MIPFNPGLLYSLTEFCECILSMYFVSIEEQSYTLLCSTHILFVTEHYQDTVCIKFLLVPASYSWAFILLKTLKEKTAFNFWSQTHCEVQQWLYRLVGTLYVTLWTLYRFSRDHTVRGRKGVPRCCGFITGWTMEKLSNPQKLQQQGNGRDETGQFIINQLNLMSGQLHGDVSSDVSAVRTRGGEDKRKEKQGKKMSFHV